MGSAKGTDHASPYTYDTHVPLAFYGLPFQPGTYRDKAEPVDLAATLASLAGHQRAHSRRGPRADRGACAHHIDAATEKASHDANSAAPDLSVNVAGIQLKNPVIAASGTFGYGVEFEDVVHLGKLGGFVVKGLSREPMIGNPPPRLWETAAGMLNAIGLQNIGARAFLEEKLPHLRQLKNIVVMANVFGYTREDYEHTIQILNEGEGIAAYELNVSCPNTQHGGLQFGSDPRSLDEVVSTAKRVCAASADRETVSQCDQHRADGLRRAGSRRGCAFADQYLYRHGDRSRNAQAAHRQCHRRAFRTGHQADRGAHGL